ncbi:hypothetical protein OsI_38481 [Oryza sativa Indica Group]|uniref:Uncharacterized protein n=1 Tax=Oryza sativa subsp. indica TaxID=39946 RepID=B8BM40_ORYSI|nr:hypothetical protein OsI_38481 [Oryza sativa Indica Group]
MQVANGLVERRVSEDGGGSGAKVDGDGQGIAAADPGRLAWHGSRDNDKRQRKWAANLGGTPPGFPSPAAAIIQRHWLGLCYAPSPSSG